MPLLKGDSMDSMELLRELVSMDSVFPKERRIAEFIEMILIENGFQIKRIEVSPGRFNLVAERGTRGRPIMFYAHLDTVPPYGQWQGNPFQLREEGDKLFGLGVVDMKAGVAAILKAVEEETDRKILVVFGVDEENVSAGSHALVLSGLLKDVEFAVSTEIATSEKQLLGPQAITLGRRGRCVLEISVPGRSSHGAQAEKGVNAVAEASRLVLELEKLNGSLGSHPSLPPPTQFIRKLSAESTSLSVPDIAIIELDRHMVTPETHESVLKSTQDFIDSLYQQDRFNEIYGRRITVRLKTRETPYLQPYVVQPGDQYVQKMASAVRQVAGEPQYTYGASVSDENRFAAAGIPIISVGPKGGEEHTSAEWCSKGSYLQLIEVLKTFIRSC